MSDGQTRFCLKCGNTYTANTSDADQPYLFCSTTCYDRWFGSDEALDDDSRGVSDQLPGVAMALTICIAALFIIAAVVSWFVWWRG